MNLLRDSEFTGAGILYSSYGSKIFILPKYQVLSENKHCRGGEGSKSRKENKEAEVWACVRCTFANSIDTQLVSFLFLVCCWSVAGLLLVCCWSVAGLFSGLKEFYWICIINSSNVDFKGKISHKMSDKASFSKPTDNIRKHSRRQQSKNKRNSTRNLLLS